MKTIFVATSLAAVMALSMSQEKCGHTGTTSVSAATIASLPPGKTFDIDLTRSHTVFEFNDANTDFSRVSVRTTAGVRPLSEMLERSNTSVKRGIVLGTPADIRNHLPPSTGGGTTHFDCGVFCKCNDTLDCIDLIVAGKCGDDMWCSKDTTACFCTAKL